MKKIIWIDIGTHEGQEYKSMFSSNLWFIFRFFRTFVSSSLFRRNKFIGFKQSLLIFNNRKRIKKARSNFRVVFIEANSYHFHLEVYRHSDDNFCFAMSDNSNGDLSIDRLYHANSNPKSQGNSIYINKGNVSESSFTLCPVVSADSFAKSYKIFLDKTYEDYEIVLRINCEGSEDNVIYAFTKHFGDKFRNIFGSLKDVENIKGETPYLNLIDHLILNKVKYIEFSPLFQTWHIAHKEIVKIINNSN